MEACVLYARVSSKEQQDEGYSIPAQLKAIRTFCSGEGLAVAAEFVEVESAGQAGRRQFGEMCAFLRSQPDVHVVVAHKLDRLYRNFGDMLQLEEQIGARARYVIGDIPPGSYGELMRNVQLSFARFYLRNLSEEVKKGLREKVEQGGYPCRAPLGYVNDRIARSIEPDPVQARFVRYAFQRYATGLVSLDDLAQELHREGLRHLRSGRKVYASSLHVLLRNPVYCGFVKYQGKLYEGRHQPLVSLELFQRVQANFEPNRNGNKQQRHVFALRDFLTCDVCGCKITAELQKGHVYYRCTKGKGRDVCSERAYTRGEVLEEQVEEILGTIELGPDILAALVEESRLLDRQEADGHHAEREALGQAIADADRRAGKLLDGYVDGVVDAAAYQTKAKELSDHRLTFERRLEALADAASPRTARVEALARSAASARLRFKGANVEEQREVLSTVLSNATLRNREIASYQLKSPFEVLQTDSKGALLLPTWAILDLNQ